MSRLAAPSLPAKDHSPLTYSLDPILQLGGTASLSVLPLAVGKRSRDAEGETACFSRNQFVPFFE